MKNLCLLPVACSMMLTATLHADECASSNHQTTITHQVNKPAAPQAKDIIDTAVGAGSFNTLAAALQAADLIDALKGKGPFTVFAPTDEAFAKLPAGTVEDLLKPENKEKLQSIMTYHVVSGAVKAAQVVAMSEATTLNGKPVTIQVMGDKVMINNAQVTATDIECTNGIIHVIDHVILPPSDNTAETAAK